MNSVGMIYQQTPSTAVPSGKSKAVSAETAMEFKQLLSGKNTAEDRNEDSPSDMEAANAAGDTSHSIDNLPDELKQLLLDNDFLATVFSDIISRIAAGEEQEIVQELEQGTLPDVLADYVDQLIAAVPDGEESGTATVEEMINNNPLLSLLFASNPLTLTGTNGDLKANQTEEQSVMQKQFASLIAQVNQLLSSIQTKEDAIKAAPKMLEMLQQWQELAKSSNGSGMQSLVAPNNEQSEDLAVWKNLLETYQKREHFAGKQLYNTDSKVTVTDVSKWLGNALELDRTPVNNVTAGMQTALPTSKLEQYAIYINQSQTNPNQSPDRQLIEQFQKIMNTSKFSAMPNGTNLLSIALRPNNLGEMMVRFTQINGEMTVRILVSSSAAKEMLESNVHQLKNMFSPHQVVVEKQDLTIQTTNAQKEQGNSQLKDQGNQQESGQSDQQDRKNGDNSFELQFEELLMNEKV